MDLGERVLSPRVDDLVEQAVHDGVFPGAVVLVSAGGKVRHFKAYGYAQKLPAQRPMHRGTVFDLASLTKVLATTSAVMSLTQDGRMSLDDPVSRHVPGFSGGWRDRILISDLLVHGAGLPAWRPFYEELEHGVDGAPVPPGTPEARAAIMALAKASPQVQPRGASAIYSDVGFIVLTEAVERAVGKRLDAYCTERVFEPLGLGRMFFLPLDEEPPRHGLPAEAFATTEYSKRLERYLTAEVHDENAHAMGGVSGHAGLFAGAEDVHTLSLTLLRAYHGEGGGLFEPDVVREFWRRRVFPDGTMRAYGWDVPAREGSAAGRHFTGLSVGHLGFTGTSVWIDVAREIIVVLLTNRVHPTRDNDKIKEFRPLLHDLIMEKLVPEIHAPPGSRAIEATLGEELPLRSNSQTGIVPQWVPATDAVGESPVEPPAASRPLEAIWFKCKNCREIIYRPDFEANLNVCVNCGFHHYLPVRRRIDMMLDEGSFMEVDGNIVPVDPLEFKDSKTYRDRLAAVQKKLGVYDAFVYGYGTLEELPVHLGVFDFTFLGGSMGSVVGEKVTRMFERALAEHTGAILIAASGGARMQEGVLSLMQMAKSCAALAKLKEAALPYISLLCHPTTGGVAASFSMLGDVNIAEPGALIGFAGPRVIEQTIRQKLPEGFQRAEYLLEHGMVDMIVERKDLRRVVATIYAMLYR